MAAAKELDWNKELDWVSFYCERNWSEYNAKIDRPCIKCKEKGGGTKAYELRITGEPLCYDCACGFPKTKGVFPRVSDQEQFHTLIFRLPAPQS